MNIEIALKSRSYILDLDCAKLSLGIFFSELLEKELFSPAFRIYLYFCQKHTPKSRKFNVLPNFLGCSLECNIFSIHQSSKEVPLPPSLDMEMLPSLAKNN